MNEILKKDLLEQKKLIEEQIEFNKKIHCNMVVNKYQRLLDKLNDIIKDAECEELK